MTPTDPTTAAAMLQIERDAAICLAARLTKERDDAKIERTMAENAAREAGGSADRARSDLAMMRRDRDSFRDSLLQFRGAVARVLGLPDGEMTAHDLIVGSISAALAAARDRNEVAAERAAAMQAITELHEAIGAERKRANEACEERDAARRALAFANRLVGAMRDALRELP